jgi:hypothetical protein
VDPHWFHCTADADPTFLGQGGSGSRDFMTKNKIKIYSWKKNNILNKRNCHLLIPGLQEKPSAL